MARLFRTLSRVRLRCCDPPLQILRHRRLNYIALDQQLRAFHLRQNREFPYALLRLGYDRFEQDMEVPQRPFNRICFKQVRAVLRAQ